MMKQLGLFIIYFVTLTSIVFLVDAVPLDECPLPEENYPCYCEEEHGITDMHCNNLNETKQLYEGLKSLTNYKIYKVNLFRVNIKPVKSDAFRGPAISQIVFTNSSIFMESPQFLGLESSLKRLSFLACFNEENSMNTWSFSHLATLKDVAFERNSIRTLTNDWISSSGPNLRSVTFAECSINKLDNKVFQKVTELATLFLNDNEISSISRSMFPKPAENLRTINLNNNKLQDLPDDIFEDMPSLNSLELQKNLLKTLSESTWAAIIENLSRVYLDENPFRCDNDLKWISKKRLPKTFTGTCREPARLSNRDLRLLTPADFH